LREKKRWMAAAAVLVVVVVVAEPNQLNQMNRLTCMSLSPPHPPIHTHTHSIRVHPPDNSKWELQQMAASAECVAAIQGALAKKGVQGRKTSQAALQQIERARALIQEARRREREMDVAGRGEMEPPPVLSVERMQGVMDLYRDAIELLSSASDERQQVCGAVRARDGDRHDRGRFEDVTRQPL
jgi:hypothetical protein